MFDSTLLPLFQCQIKAYIFEWVFLGIMLVFFSTPVCLLYIYFDSVLLYYFVTCLLFCCLKALFIIWDACRLNKLGVSEWIFQNFYCRNGQPAGLDYMGSHIIFCNVFWRNKEQNSGAPIPSYSTLNKVYKPNENVSPPFLHLIPFHLPLTLRGQKY